MRTECTIGRPAVRPPFALSPFPQAPIATHHQADSEGITPLLFRAPPIFRRLRVYFPLIQVPSDWLKEAPFHRAEAEWHVGKPIILVEEQVDPQVWSGDGPPVLLVAHPSQQSKKERCDECGMAR